MSTSDLEKYVDRSEKAKGDDERLATIMTDMEQKYEIPWHEHSLPEWEKRTPEAKQILKVYRHISGLRSV